MDKTIKAVMERELMAQGMSQNEAHIKTSKVYDYAQGVADYYASLKK